MADIFLDGDINLQSNRKLGEDSFDLICMRILDCFFFAYTVTTFPYAVFPEKYYEVHYRLQNTNIVTGRSARRRLFLSRGLFLQRRSVHSFL